MNVVVLIGGRAGTVQDVPVEHARAMVADGRARWPDGSPHAPPLPAAQADGAGEPTETPVLAVLAQTASAPVVNRVPQVGYVPREKSRGRR